RSLAAGTVRTNATERAEDLSQVALWRLENGRGIRTLRGLLTPASHLRFSPDGRYVGAIATEWKLAIWDQVTGELKHILEVPEGYAYDSASLAFSRDGRQIAFSSGDHASLWDVATGRRLRNWTLPPGLVDFVAFPPSDDLLLFRVETKSGQRGPFRNA